MFFKIEVLKKMFFVFFIYFFFFQVELLEIISENLQCMCVIQGGVCIWKALCWDGSDAVEALPADGEHSILSNII